MQTTVLSFLLAYLYTTGRLAQTVLEEKSFTPHSLGGSVSFSSGKGITAFQNPKTEAPPMSADTAATATNYSLPLDFVPKIYEAVGQWDVAPIVVEEYKLLFFTQGKVACTEFKKLFRRMMHLENWQLHKEPKIPHNPQYNGLAYLYMYPWPRARQMLTDPGWTRAIFVRDPKERFLSAFLDKAAKKNGIYVDRHCCSTSKDCGAKASRSLLDFIELVQSRCCCDPHWKPQSRRIDPELWDSINFVGYFDSLADDTQRLLERLGAWEEYGASGWGKFQNESIFVESSTAKHRTSARTKMLHYFNDSRTEKMVDDFYAGDYDRFHFERYQLSDATQSSEQ